MHAVRMVMSESFVICTQMFRHLTSDSPSRSAVYMWSCCHSTCSVQVPVQIQHVHLLQICMLDRQAISIVNICLYMVLGVTSSAPFMSQKGNKKTMSTCTRLRLTSERVFITYPSVEEGNRF